MKKLIEWFLSKVFPVYLPDLDDWEGTEEFSICTASLTLVMKNE